MITSTLAIIKPGAVRAGHTDAILTQIKKAGFAIVQRVDRELSLAQAEKFYEIHRERPFYGELCAYMSSGPIVALHLEKENAVAAFRELIGATDPLQAASGTIRQKFGKSIDDNAIHGSDANETAKGEIAFFFGS